ncbi:UNVERIFIED_CONTAM: proteasome activator pa28 beta subunit protein [Hammondia hammondi]|eukprot:XP_008881818.1 proteasome activator pa28 beta subunit protein [Hammondia hammondi]
MESEESAAGGMRRLEASEASAGSAAGTGPAPSSCSSFSSFSPSLAAAPPAGGSKKRARGSSAKTTGGDRGIAEAVRLMQSGKLAKLEPSEEKVKEDYEQYRNDVTRRALKILTDDLPRRIARFLRLVDVNAEPGTLLVCDDLPPPPSLGPLLSPEELATFTVERTDGSESSACDASSHSPQASFPWRFSVDPVVSLSAADSGRLKKMLEEKVKAVFGGDRTSEKQSAAPKAEAEETGSTTPELHEDSSTETRQTEHCVASSPSSCASSSSSNSSSASASASSSPSAVEGWMSRQEAICARVGEQAQFVKEEAVAMRELLNAVKIFMQLHVPRIEDGNNFGVAIQEEAIHLLNRVEESAFNLYDTVMKYYVARAKLCSKLVKYPNTLDYQTAVVELDRKEWVHLKITNLDLRNNYIMLYDLICKNWQNVIAPKGRSHSTSQQAMY